MPYPISQNHIIPNSVLSQMHRTGASRVQRIDRGFIYKSIIDINAHLYHQEIAFSPELFNASKAQIHNHNQLGYLTSISSLNTGNQILQSAPTVPIIGDLNSFIRLTQINPYNFSPAIYNFNNNNHHFYPSYQPSQPVYQLVLDNMPKHNIII